MIDVSPGNVIFTCRTLLEDGDEYLIESLGGEHFIAEYTGASPRPPNLPGFLMDIATYKNWFDCPEEEIRLVDWGESFPIDQTPTGIAQPPDLNSPETFFVGHFDYAHDLWRAGCVVRCLAPWLFLFCLPYFCSTLTASPCCIPDSSSVLPKIPLWLRAQQRGRNRKSSSSTGSTSARVACQMGADDQ